jgi:hypothetical protein
MGKYATALILCMIFAASALYADRPVPLLDEKITYSNKGTRSEASHHDLLVNGKAIPDTFRLVWQEGRLYRFHQRRHIWGSDGYVPLREAPAGIPQSDKTISDQDTKRKWYLGSARLIDTPLHWAYVEWEGGAAFVDPIMLNLFAEKQGLPIIKRSTMENYFKE